MRLLKAGDRALTTTTQELRGAILDVDGVLWLGGKPVSGAPGMLDELQRAGLPFCLLTNDCSVSKMERYARLDEAGFHLDPAQLVTAAEITREWLEAASADVILYLGSAGALEDLGTAVRVRTSGPVDAVVLGDPFDCVGRSLLDCAASAIDRGAPLVAMQRSRRWSDGVVSHVDNGFWIAGLEYVTGHRAIVTGKPSRGAYLAGLRRLGLEASARSRVVVVSDDVPGDLRGAKKSGLRTVHFGASHVRDPWVDHEATDMEALADLLLAG